MAKVSIRSLNQKYYYLKLQREYKETDELSQNEGKRLKKYWEEWYQEQDIVLNDKLKEKITSGEIIDGTYNPHNGKIIRKEKGYYVGIETLNLDNPVFKSKELLGAWRDYNTGKIFIDKVEWVKERKEAIKRGKERGEIAIWDIENNKEIRL